MRQMRRVSIFMDINRHIYRYFSWGPGESPGIDLGVFVQATI